MKGVSKKTLKTSLKNYKTKAAQAGFQWANQWAGFQWNAVVLLGAILLSSLFVGKGLQAQDSQTSKIGKGSWFIGVTPYVLGLSESKTSARIASATPTGVTVDSDEFSFTAVAPSDIELGEEGAQAKAQEVAKNICKTGFAIPATNNTDATNTGFNDFQFALENGTYNNSVYAYNDSTHCRDHFTTLLANATQAVTFKLPETSKPATAKWSGAGLHFGWQFPEGNRVGLQIHNWKGGDSEISSQIAMYDYFFSKGFYAGVGAGTLQLKALGKTQSQTAPAVNLGWQYSIKENFKLELGYLLLNAEVSIKKETRATRNLFARVEVPPQVVYVGFRLTGHYGSHCNPVMMCSLNGFGTKVTGELPPREISQEHEIMEIQEVTVSKPSVIYIRLSLSF